MKIKKKIRKRDTREENNLRKYEKSKFTRIKMTVHFVAPTKVYSWRINVKSQNTNFDPNGGHFEF